MGYYMAMNTNLLTDPDALEPDTEQQPDEHLHLTDEEKDELHAE